MSRTFTLLILILGLGLVSCSNGKKGSTGNKDKVASASDEFEFTDEEFEDDFVSDAMESKNELEPLDTNGEVATYTVSKNETLMMVSFNIYGDYRRWREVANMNRDVLSSSKSLSPGMLLKYKVPAQEFSFRPDGEPYVIRHGDTLGIISSNTYGTARYWKDIWYNNRPLILDPNVIFAGFTIYTPFIDTKARGVAND